MTLVNREKFYKKINSDKLDVIVSVIGNYPYTSIFKFRNGIEYGRIVDMGTGIKSKYYLKNIEG